ncbi:MAG: hypothetical protein IJQ71_11105 [Clostridia bacterium]|jgi:hypothetical protein|nr:hypothetical protein [Clostridia bacterium]
MLIVAYVCAEFHDKTGTVIHRIRPEDLRVVTEAPEAIRQDPLFDLLVREGSLKVPDTKNEVKKLENDPEPKVPVTKVQKPAGNNSSAALEDEKKSSQKSAENK